ncbi:MAG: ribose 5-phosphate isomerase A [Acidimicrobiia bacterium]
MAKWSNALAAIPGWVGEIAHLEAKRSIANIVASRVSDGDVVGVGSGSTAFLALQACAEHAVHTGISFTAIPTSIETAQSCVAFGVPTTSLMGARPDWCFDGADEVDGDHRLIKGRGGACFREKLVWRSCLGTRLLLVDASKFVEQLGSTHSVPVEVVPEALMLVDSALRALPEVIDVAIRSAGSGKDGPVLTEYGNLLLEVRFGNIPAGTEAQLDAIPGVVASGLFEDNQLEIVAAQ